MFETIVFIAVIVTSILLIVIGILASKAINLRDSKYYRLPYRKSLIEHYAERKKKK